MVLSCSPSTFVAPWFGKPGAMQLLPKPDAGITRPSNRSVVTHDLLSGATGTTRRRRATRPYGLSWSQQGPDKAELMRSYYLGVHGPGPYCLVDPTERNNLDLDVSTLGLRGFGTGWLAAGGSAALDTTGVVGPVFDSAVLRWTGAGVNAVLWPGVLLNGAADVDVLTAPPCLPGVPVVFSVYARTATGTAVVNGYLNNRNGDGSLSTGANLLTATLTTAWQRLTVATTIATGNTAKYLMPSLACVNGGNPDVLVAAPQFEYGLLVPRPFVVGQRVPRVSFGEGDAATSSINYRTTRAFSLYEF